MKVAINACYGGFGLSPAAVLMMAARKGITLTVDNSRNPSSSTNYQTSSGEAFSPYALYSDRTDPDLIYVIETLGEEANGVFAKLRIVDIPDDIEWEINDYDGRESVDEVHRSWS